MATKFSPNNIQNLSQDWGRDESDMPLFRPYSGRAVQKLVRDNLSELHETKFGYAQYEGVIYLSTMRTKEQLYLRWLYLEQCMPYH